MSERFTSNVFAQAIGIYGRSIGICKRPILIYRGSIDTES